MQPYQRSQTHIMLWIENNNPLIDAVNINHIYPPLKVLLQTTTLLNEEPSSSRVLKRHEYNESLNILNVLFDHIKFTLK